MVGIICFDMIVQHGYSDPLAISEPIQAIKGQTKIFQLEKGQKDMGGGLKFIVNRVFETTNTTANTISTPPDTAASKTSLSAKTPQTPATTESRQITAKRQLFDPPDNPSATQRELDTKSNIMEKKKEPLLNI